MTTLQIALPEDVELSPEALERITGRSQRSAQLAWLNDHHWQHELAADGSVIVGKLYAHLRLAGLQPGQVNVASASGFDFSNVR